MHALLLVFCLHQLQAAHRFGYPKRDSSLLICKHLAFACTFNLHSSAALVKHPASVSLKIFNAECLSSWQSPVHSLKILTTWLLCAGPFCGHGQCFSNRCASASQVRPQRLILRPYCRPKNVRPQCNPEGVHPPCMYLSCRCLMLAV